jgi:hypothetical protein
MEIDLMTNPKELDERIHSQASGVFVQSVGYPGACGRRFCRLSTRYLLDAE